jgi:DNA-directed RNA polymerase subunit L
MFRNYTESGPTLLTDAGAKSIGKFTLVDTSTTIANTLRRCILTETRSVGFRADLTNAADPGVVIRKNTSVIFNEMLAHRLTLIPLGVRNIDAFDPSRYECVLTLQNDTKGPIANANLRHVKTSDFIVREKQADGTFETLNAAATAALFPKDTITNDTPLIITLRPQWNAEQPAEEIDLTAYPVIGRGREFMGFCPVSQCSFANTLDTDPVRQEQFFSEWLASFKKISDLSSVPPEVIEAHRKEWSTLSVQRCFLVDDKGEPNSFDFTVESVGIRPVQDIVAEGIQAVINLIEPYADSSKSMDDLGITTQPVDSRMNGIDVVIDGQEHTLGNLLQTLITELYLDTGAPDSPITFAGYKVRHPLQRKVTLRLGIREGLATDPAALAREVIATAAARAMAIFQDLARSWAASVSGVAGAGGEAVPELDG